MQQANESKKTTTSYAEKADGSVTDGNTLAERYSHLTACVYATIKEVVPEKKWIKKNGRVVSKETKELFEKRAREFQKKKPTASRRKQWNKKIRVACRNDYRLWVTRWVSKIEEADRKGDTKAIYRGAKALGGAAGGRGKKPTERKQKKEQRASGEQPEIAASTEPKVAASQVNDSGASADVITDATKNTRRKKDTADYKRINCPEELAEVWQQFLEKKFSETELEKSRAEFEALPASDEGELTRKEFEEAVNRAKNSKAVGQDGIPAEVWKHSDVAKNALFEFLRAVWSKEEVPANLVVCIFVLIFKNKGSHNDLTKYRAIGLLNHAYKIMSTVLMLRLVKECKKFFSEWQAGFRSERGCRDNTLLLRVLYDRIIGRDQSCIVTFIDYTAAFDSISQKFLDKTLKDAGASLKSRAIFRAIYEAASGVARVQSIIDGQRILSQAFNVARGVIQGDIMSPVLFILALDQLIQNCDRQARGIKAGRLLRFKVFGYADDAALVDDDVGSMTTRLTLIADTSRDEADMYVSLPKTLTQHVHRREDVKVSEEEARVAEKEHKHVCDFCPRRFKTRRGMLIHRARCMHNYDTTDEAYVVQHISSVFGHIDARWYLVKWQGYKEPEWERGHLLERDGCRDSIRRFWVKTGLNPSKEFYEVSDGKHRCAICCKPFGRAQDLKAHKTREGHHEDKRKTITRTAVQDAILQKRKDMQADLPHVKWGDLDVGNCWRFKYLGSIFQADGAQMPDVKSRIAMASARFGKFRHIWTAGDLHLNLRMRLYKACICSILTYGSEAWRITAEVAKALNGANARMVIVITGRTPQQEASAKWRTF